jgi:hypothetical protein
VLCSEYLNLSDKKNSGVGMGGGAQLSAKKQKFSMKDNKHGVSSTRCLLEDPLGSGMVGIGRARIGSTNIE